MQSITEGPGPSEQHPTLACACRCSWCGIATRMRLRFQLTDATGAPAIRCVWCAVRYWPVARRALLAAGTVGVLLLAINPGPRMLSTGLSPAVAERSLTTFVICYAVSVFSALAVASVHSDQPATTART